MSHKPQSKDEALEALDFIVNVLKEHEKDLDKLIRELGSVTEQIGSTSDLSVKVEKIEEKVSSLQDEIGNLVNCLSTGSQNRSTHEMMAPTKELKPVELAQPMQPSTNAQTAALPTPPVILRCKQWEDFQSLAFQASTMSFMVKETERTFQVDALKGNQVITFTGEIPKAPVLLKIWLARQLEVTDKKILEGALAIS